LHRYACEKLQEVSPAIEPKLYAVETGYRIIVTNAPLGDPKLRYRKEVERLAKQREGKLSAIVLAGLEVRGEQLGLAMDIVEEIHNDVLRPYREFEQKLQRYEQMFTEAIETENPLSSTIQEDLKYLQQVLGLTEENIAPIQQQFTNSSTNDMEPDATRGSESLEDPFENLSDKLFSSLDFLIQGLEKQNEGDLKGAIADYDQAIRLNPDFAHAYYKRGNARFKVGDKREAIADYDQVIKLEPDYAGPYNNRGNARYALGDKQGAIKDLQKAIELTRQQGDTERLQKASKRLEEIQK
jgi:tetratricopeptide (TPR) repeat protein